MVPGPVLCVLSVSPIHWETGWLTEKLIGLSLSNWGGLWAGRLSLSVYISMHTCQGEIIFSVSSILCVDM